MRSPWETTALLGLALLLTACDTSQTPAPAPAPTSTPTVVTPPPAPVPVPVPTPPPATTPTSYPVKLTWIAPSTRANGTALSIGELSGYRIYYMREGSAASDDVTISIPGANTTSYKVTLGVAGSYTFAVTAVDANGLESPLSGEVSISIK
jgi:hypothetical protein